LQINEKTQKQDEIAYTLDHIGSIHKNMRNFSLAMEYYQRSLAIHQQLDNKEGIAINLINIGGIHRQQKNYTEALACYEKALPTYQTLKSEKEVSSILDKLAQVYADMEDVDNAMLYYTKALEIHEKLKSKSGMIQSFKGLGGIYQKQKDYQKAMGYYEKALTYAQETGITLEIQQITSNLYEIAKQQGNYAQALAYYEQYKTVQDSLLTIEKTKKIASLESILALNRKEQELSLANIAREREKNGRLALEKEQEAQRLLNIAKEEKDKRKQDSLKTLAVQAQLEADKYRAEEKRLQAESKAHLLELKREKQANAFRFYLACAFALALGFMGLFVYFAVRGRQVERRAKEAMALQKEEIETQAEQLDTSNKTKDRLFAIIAHDLRSPITAFQGVAKQVQAFLRKDKPERILELMETVDAYSHQLQNLLDNLLNWALLQSNYLSFSPENLQARAEVTHCLKNFEPFAKAQNIILENTVLPETIIQTDRQVLQTILRNLISNALKFTREGGKIEVGNAIDQASALYVRDTGIGISPEALPTLSQVSEQESRQGLQGEKGLGVGLSLCYELAKLNQLQIGVESVVNVGTTFYITPKEGFFQ
jgi:signal transduction histidine kinase